MNHHVPPTIPDPAESHAPRPVAWAARGTTAGVADLDASVDHMLASLRTPHHLMIAVIGIPLLMMFAISSFAWPASRLEPRDLPVGLVGPAQATEAIAGNLEDRGFEVNRYDDEASAREAIEDRDLYGALMLAPGGVTLFTASAASPAVTQLLQQAVSSQLATDPNAPPAPLTVVDVVPADSDDPRGAALAASVTPLVLAGIITGVAMAVVSVPGMRQIYGLLGMSVLVGMAATLVVQSWLGVIGGNWWLNAGVLSLIVLAISSVLAGCVAVAGLRGIAIAIVLMLFMGNPWSGITSAPELMPTSVGITGQLLPPGAGGSLLRSTAFFDGAGSWVPLTVLIVWILVGVAAVWGGAILHGERGTTRVALLGIRPAITR